MLIAFRGNLRLAQDGQLTPSFLSPWSSKVAVLVILVHVYHWTQGERQVLGGAALDLAVAAGASVKRLVEETIETTLAAYMR